MDIPENILEELKCSICNSYLSKSPVYLNHSDGKALCNLCYDSDDSATRNKQYESVAKLLKFPCQYQELGCKSTVPFMEETENIPHEEECEFRPFVCPLLDSNDCDWMGTKNKLLLHCQSQHPTQVVENPLILTHEIRHSNVHNYLLTAFNFLFLLHTKVCVTTGKIFHAVRLIGDSSKAEEFEFTVDVKQGKNSISRSGKVAPQGCMTMKEAISVILNINSILDVMGTYENTTFIITLISMKKCVKCGLNVLKYIFHNEEGWLCEYCIPEKRLCKNTGCTYKDFDYKCIKHELFFCMFTKSCFLCNNKYRILQRSIFEHYTETHQNQTFLLDSTWRATISNDRQHCLISNVVGTMVCQYITRNSQFSLYMILPVPSDQLNNFQCIIKITNPETLISQTFTPNLSPYIHPNDYHVILNKDEFSWTNSGFDIAITIKKIS